MSKPNPLSALFNKLSEIVGRRGDWSSPVDEETGEVDSDTKNVVFSEFTLTMRGQHNDGLTFDLFGTWMFLLPDGAVLVASEDETGEDQFHRITEPKLLREIAVWLKWRIGIIEGFDI